VERGGEGEGGRGGCGCVGVAEERDEFNLSLIRRN